MNHATNQSSTSVTTDLSYDPTYDDSIEGKLQHMVDQSLWFKQQMEEAKTSVKRDLYRRKLVKNNNKMFKLLIRTPNAFNPFMEALTNNPSASMTAPEADTVGEAEVAP